MLKWEEGTVTDEVTSDQRVHEQHGPVYSGCRGVENDPWDKQAGG